MAWDFQRVRTLPVIGQVLYDILVAYSDATSGHDHDGSNSKAFAFADALKSAHIADAEQAVAAAGSGSAAATLATGVEASNNALTWTARDAGHAGNGISVALVDPAGEGQALAVTVNGNDIVVSLATNSTVVASLTTALAGDNNDLVFTALAGGDAGNDITVAYVDPGAPGEALSVALVGTDITVNLATAAAVAASLTTALAGDNNDLVFTADATGVAGDNITVTYTDPGAANVLSVDVEGTAINVLLGHDGAAITSTAQNVMDAINADTEAAALVTAALADGNDGAGVVTAMLATPLAGGSDGGAITSTAADVAAALAADGGIAALVGVANADGNDGTGVVTAMAQTPLAGGVTGAAITSTAAEVAAAIAASANANSLVSVANTGASDGSGAVTALAATNLAGGADPKSVTGAEFNALVAKYNDLATKHNSLVDACETAGFLRDS